MHIVITKDSATKIPKECSEAEAEAYAQNFVVEVVAEDGSTTTFAEWKFPPAEDPAAESEAAAEAAGETAAESEAAAD